MGSRLPEGAREADAILPIATLSEMDGTFANFEARVQRFHQALQPPGIARPAWMVLSRVLAALGEGEPVNDVSAAFDVMADGVPSFTNLSWGGLGLKGAMTGPGAPAAAGAGDTGEAAG